MSQRTRSAVLRAQCMDESKATTLNLRKKECHEYVEDYNECLHHGKEVRAD